MPGDYDFDYILRLDADLQHKDTEKIPVLVAALTERLGGVSKDSHSDNNGGFQLRLLGATNVAEQPVDIDIGFVPKAEVQLFTTNQAISERLAWIRNHVSEEAYETTITNIVLAKDLLKKGGAYKKVEHGGMGGVGVENWILLNGGNLEQAFRAFWDVAHEAGQTRSFVDFQSSYKILDPGINLKFNKHDDFVKVLKPEGYQAMLKVIGEYLNLT
jgi:hypothetical protein